MLDTSADIHSYFKDLIILENTEIGYNGKLSRTAKLSFLDTK
jgi:hypothetical protein